MTRTADFYTKSANPSTASGPPTLKGQARTTPRFFNSHGGSFVVPDSPVTAVRVSWLPSLGELSAAILSAFDIKLQRLTEGFTAAIISPLNPNLLFTSTFEYKALFTKEEYEGVSTDDEFYELITKVNSISPKVRKSDIFITGWRNYLSANLYTSHGTYRIDYGIWMRPNYLTGSYKISKWDVTVNELDKEE